MEAAASAGVTDESLALVEEWRGFDCCNRVDHDSWATFNTNSTLSCSCRHHAYTLSTRWERRERRPTYTITFDSYGPGCVCITLAGSLAHTAARPYCP
jgi:hypothetical protein